MKYGRRAEKAEAELARVLRERDERERQVHEARKHRDEHRAAALAAVRERDEAREGRLAAISEAHAKINALGRERDEARIDALEWKLACGRRDEDMDKDVLAVVRERDEQGEDWGLAVEQRDRALAALESLVRVHSTPSDPDQREMALSEATACLAEYGRGEHGI